MEEIKEKTEEMEETKTEEKILSAETDTKDVEEKAEKKEHKIWSAVSNILFVVLIAALLYTPYRYNVRYIESGSMEPQIHVGAIVLVDPKAYDNADPQVGDVAMYQTSTREVIHRIIGETDDDSYIFKGDNNDSEDFSPVPKEYIRGKLVCKINIVAPIIKAIKHLGL